MKDHDGPFEDVQLKAALIFQTGNIESIGVSVHLVEIIPSYCLHGNHRPSRQALVSCYGQAARILMVCHLF